MSKIGSKVFGGKEYTARVHENNFLQQEEEQPIANRDTDEDNLESAGKEGHNRQHELQHNPPGENLGTNEYDKEPPVVQRTVEKHYESIKPGLNINSFPEAKKKHTGSKEG